MTCDGDGDTVLRYEAVPGRSAWLRVFFEHRDPLEIPLKIWVERSLKAGMRLDDTELAAIERESRIGAACDRAVRYISRRMRSRGEVARYLRQIGCEPDIADEAVERLVALRLLDDEAFSGMYIESSGERLSRRELAWRLRQKGINRDVVMRGLYTEEGAARELRAARKLADKFFRTRTGLEPRVVRERLGAYLQRKGFPMSVIYAVLAELPFGEDGGVP